VIRTENAEDSAAWILRLAIRRQGRPSRDLPVYAQRPQRDRQWRPEEQALAAAPGISTVTARSLLAHFGCFRAVALADPEELLRVPGIGRTRAEALSRMMEARWTPATSARDSAQQNPST
jgi:ERCC4-type nuclease